MKRPHSETWAGARNRDGDRIPSMERLRSEKGLYKDEAQLLREERGTSRHGRTSYRYCKDHKRVEEATSECFEVEAVECDAPTVRVFQPYWDPNLAPKTHNGLPVYVRSARHKRELLRANGLVEIG